MFGSGYFFVKNIYNKPLHIVKHKIKKILLPLYFWNLFYGIIIAILKLFHIISYGAPLNFSTLFLTPIYSGHSFEFNLASWFLIPLFMIQIFSIIFLPLLKKNKGPYFVFIIYMLLGMFGIYISMKGYNTGWLLVLTRFLYFLPFFGLGILYNTKLEKRDSCSNVLYFSVVLFLQLILVYYKGGLRGYTPSWCFGFDDIITPYLFGFFAIAFWIRVSKILVPILKDSKIVKVISKNTFSIMMHHLFGFFVLNCFWAFLSLILPFMDGFNFNSFSSSVWYIYIPKGLPQFKTLYVVFGIIFSILVTMLVDKIKKLISSILKVKKKLKNENIET